MKKTLLVAALSLALIVTVAEAALDAVPKTITTEKTAKHREVFDIPLLVGISQRNTIMKTPTGVVDKKTKITLDASVLYTPLETLLVEFGDKKLKERGLELKSASEFNWNGARALLMKIFRPLQDGRIKGQWILVVDRNDHTWMVNGAYDAKNQQSSAEILAILQTAWWDPNEAPGTGGRTPNGALDTSGTPFKLAKVSSGALIYTKDGRLPTDSPDKAVFVVSKINNSHIPVGKRAEFAKANCVSAALGNELEIVSEKKAKNETLSEIVAKADNEEDESIIYQTMLFGAAHYNVMIGITRTTDETNVGYFRKLTEDAISKFGS